MTEKVGGEIPVKRSRKVRKRVKKSTKKTSKTTPKSARTPKKTIKLNLNTLSLTLVSIALIVSLVGTISLFNINENFDGRGTTYDTIFKYMGKIIGRVDELKELAIPAKITIVSIVDTSCSDCSDISSLIDSVKKNHVNVTSEKTLNFGTSEASLLIKKYNIDIIPTVIVTSNEFDKTSLKKQWEKLGTVENDGSLVLRTLNPPYHSISKNAVLGRVTLTFLKDSSCVDCLKSTPLINQLKASGVSITNQKQKIK